MSVFSSIVSQISGARTLKKKSIHSVGWLLLYFFRIYLLFMFYVTVIFTQRPRSTKQDGRIRGSKNFF